MQMPACHQPAAERSSKLWHASACQPHPWAQAKARHACRQARLPCGAATTQPRALSAPDLNNVGNVLSGVQPRARLVAQERQRKGCSGARDGAGQQSMQCLWRSLSTAHSDRQGGCPWQQAAAGVYPASTHRWCMTRRQTGLHGRAPGGRMQQLSLAWPSGTADDSNIEGLAL